MDVCCSETVNVAPAAALSPMSPLARDPLPHPAHLHTKHPYSCASEPQLLLIGESISGRWEELSVAVAFKHTSACGEESWSERLMDFWVFRIAFL